MTPAGRTRRQPGTIADARTRLRDAERSLDAAQPVNDPSVIAARAIDAAVAAADAVCCVALRERPADGDPLAAIELLSHIDKRLSAALKRALNRSAQAAYESRDISVSDAKVCLRQAAILLDAARERVLSA
jgi:hypothetical protein